MMKDKSKDLLEVGVVVGTHGLKGDLKIRPLPTGDLALPGARTVYLRDSEGLPVRHEAVRSSLHKQNILLRLSGLENIAAVEGLIGAFVLMDHADLPGLFDDRFYWSDLEGMAVIDRQQGEIGRVIGMFSTPAHDILEIEGSAGEILVPAIEPFLVELDRDNGRLHVDLPQGLIPGTDDVSP
jgi:16S rRNA processing protein RimM